MKATLPNMLAKTLRGFFTEHLPSICGVSPHTVRSYRDALVLLLRFLADRKGRSVIDLDFQDFDQESVLAFLEYLQTTRGNSTPTRNARLAALHAFARYVAGQHPDLLEACQRLLAVPFKRGHHRPVEYLEAEELRAMLESTDRRTAEGRRDHALLLTLFNTGARVQELLDIRSRDLQLEPPLLVRLHGKGRKERLCPLWPQTAEELRGLLDETGLDLLSAERLFRNQRGQPLTRFGVRYLIRKYATVAQTTVPSLSRKRVHPHTLRHYVACRTM